jgi:putative DNA primase/helicase
MPPAALEFGAGVMTAAGQIAAALSDARREGRGWRCRCPLHGGRSLTLRDGSGGTVLVTCWGGCERLDVLAELRRCEFLAGRTSEHKPRTALPPRQFDAQCEDDTRRVARARAIWDAALPAVRSPVVRYLVSRGITMPPPPTLRWSPRCWHGESRQELPAMVAVVEHVERGIVAVHRTYIRSDGTAKGAFETIKSSLGPIRGGAVRLGLPRPGEWLAIGEGIETTLAVMMACAMPGWAALSANGIRALNLPPEATHVIICADHDASGVGQRAARDAAQRWLAEGRHVRIVLPPEPGTDFADMLLADVSSTAEVRHVA